MQRLSPFRTVVARLIAGAALVAAACSHTAGQRTASLPADCVTVRTIDDYNTLDADDLVIYGPGDDAYHVVLSTPSTQIEDEFMIGVYDDGDGRLCPYGRDAILVEGNLFEEIRIRSIESIDEAELEALLLEFGEIEEAGSSVEPEQIL